MKLVDLFTIGWTVVAFFTVSVFGVLGLLFVCMLLYAMGAG